MIIAKTEIKLKGYTVVGTDRREGGSFGDLCILEVEGEKPETEIHTKICLQYNTQGYDVKQITANADEQVCIPIDITNLN